MQYKRLTTMWIILILAIGITTSVMPQQRDRDTRRWKIIVIVQESHLSQPRIPDPAVETSLCRQLIDAGYKVIDQDRYDAIRYSAIVDRIIKGGSKTGKETIQLCRRFGADVLITGEAFTQVAKRSRIDTELGSVDRIQCRARVELKAIRVDSAEKFWSDAIHRTGPSDITEELSSKSALEDAADLIGQDLIQRMGELTKSSGQYVELEFRGIGSASNGDKVAQVIRKMPGVLEIGDGEFDA
ncbi:MAG: hypothetical protein WCO51_06140, partial [bacterium]